MLEEREGVFDVKNWKWVQEKTVFWTIKLDIGWETKVSYVFFCLKLQSSSRTYLKPNVFMPNQ